MAERRKSWFVETCRELLRNPSQMGLHKAHEAMAPTDPLFAASLLTDGAGTYTFRPTENFVVRGEEPTELELLACGRTLVQAILAPRTPRCRDILERIAKQALAKEMGTHSFDSDAISEIVATATRKAATPRATRGFVPDGATFVDVANSVRAYVVGALRNAMRDHLRTRNPNVQSTSEEDLERAAAAEIYDEEDRIIAALDSGERPDMEPYDDGLLRISRSGLARKLGRPASTLFNAIKRAQARGGEFTREDELYVLTPADLALIEAELPARRRGYARKSTAKYPKGAILFGGDVEPGASSR